VITDFREALLAVGEVSNKYTAARRRHREYLDQMESSVGKT
jgi:hypothetical protein